MTDSASSQDLDVRPSGLIVALGLNVAMTQLSAENVDALDKRSRELVRGRPFRIGRPNNGEFAGQWMYNNAHDMSHAVFTTNYDASVQASAVYTLDPDSVVGYFGRASEDQSASEDHVEPSAQDVSPIAGVPGTPDRRHRRAVHCSRALARASRLLPPSIRGDHLDIWLDHIETARQSGRPVVKSTFSILLRAVPYEALRGLARRRRRSVEN